MKEKNPKLKENFNKNYKQSATQQFTNNMRFKDRMSSLLSEWAGLPLLMELVNYLIHCYEDQSNLALPKITAIDLSSIFYCNNEKSINISPAIYREWEEERNEEKERQIEGRNRKIKREK